MFINYYFVERSVYVMQTFLWSSRKCCVNMFCKRFQSRCYDVIHPIEIALLLKRLHDVLLGMLLERFLIIILINVPVTSYTRLLDFSEYFIQSRLENVSKRVVTTIYKRNEIALLWNVFNAFCSVRYENVF